MKKNIINRFASLKIVVFGDLMLDKYILGDVTRISPEAPIPIVQVTKEKFALGGAANVAANISTLNGKAFLYGIIGADAAGNKLIEQANKLGISTSGIYRDDKMDTIQKIRVIGQHQQLLRIDYEQKQELRKVAMDFFMKKLQNSPTPNAVIISDYAKGMITGTMIEKLSNYCREKEINLIIDPKPNNKHLYKNISLMTPNLKEAQEISGMQIRNNNDLEKCGKYLNQKFDCDIIITTGEKGMSIFPKDKEPSHISTQATEVFDVSGAGDTVVATISMALAGNISLHDAAEIANIAAGIKVRKMGTAPVHLKELENEIGKQR